MGFFSEYKEVNTIIAQKQSIVFYAESRHYYQYYKRLITDLLLTEIPGILYLTSDAADPLLTTAPAGLKVVYVQWMLSFFFNHITADVMVMTMPDLGHYLIKKTAKVGHYVYVFHAMVSTHQQYTTKAFFHYDTVFCIGGYQVSELQAADKHYRLQPRTVVRYGYPLIEELQQGLSQKPASDTTGQILLAPSWYNGCIFDTCFEELITRLSALPLRTLIRFHPEYVKRRPKEFKRIEKIIAAHPGQLSADRTPDVNQSLLSSDYLITDRSGIAFEFAFGIRKPVLFIDTPLKVNNPEWQELGIVPIENRLRSEMGLSLDPEQLHELPAAIERLNHDFPGFPETMGQLGRQEFFNAPESYNNGVQYILGKIKK